MDKSMLNLLFNYKGTITQREFKAGIIILFMLILIDFIYMSINMHTNAAIARMGVDHLSSFMNYNNIASPFIPFLVPSQFIITYTSFVLSLKRMRAKSQKRFSVVISGFSNYLFFASVTSLYFLLEIILRDSTMYENNMLYITPAIVSIIVILFLIGLINVIICAKADKNQNPIGSSKDTLDPIGYIIKIGNILSFVMILALLMMGLILIFPALVNDPSLITIISRTVVLITLIFYIVYTYRRVKDAAIPVAVFITVIGVYVALSALMYWMISAQHPLLYVYSTLFLTATSLLVAAQFLLFLLPSKNNEQNS